MNKTKFIKRLLIILFIFIIAILAVNTLSKTEVTVETGEMLTSETSSETSLSTSVSSEQLIEDSYSVNTDSTWSSLPDEGTVEDGYAFLSGNWWVLCCQHGNAMSHAKLYLEQLAEYEYLTPIDAFLMANMEATNTGYPDEGQQAWWASGGGGSTTFTSVEDLITDSDIENYTGKSIDTLTEDELEAAYLALVQQYSELESSGGLLDLAERFETYICMALGGISSDELGTESDYYYTTEVDGNSVNAFDISDITFEFVDTDTDADGSFSQSDVLIYDDVYESNVFVVGPYQLSYYYDSVFSYISGSTVIVKINGEDVTLTYGTDYYFKSTSSSGLDDNGYPLSQADDGDVEFYIIIKYQAGMTEIEEVSFEYTYTNAGGRYAKYDTYQFYCPICKSETGYGWCDELHEHTYCSICGEYDVDENHTHTYCEKCGKYDVSTSHTHTVDSGDEDEYGNTIYVEKSYVTNVNEVTEVDESYEVDSTQDLAICSYAYMWTETKTIEKVYDNSAEIKIEKVTVNSDGDQIAIDDTFDFLIEIKYDGEEDWKELETVSVQTENGYGSATTSRVYWDTEDDAPEYRVTEVNVDEEEYTSVAVSDATGTLKDGTVITIEYENIVQAKTGQLQITKVFSCLTEEEVTNIDESFVFDVEISGTFEYEGTSYTDTTLSLEVELSKSSYAVYFLEEDEDGNTPRGDLIVEGSNDEDWIWISSEFSWYEDNAPTYEITEIQYENSKYELLSKSGTTGTLKEDSVATASATFDNTLKIYSYLTVDKKLASGEDPESGEVFYARVTISGDFIYDGDGDGIFEIISSDLENQTYTIDITLEEDNWLWTSNKIIWETSEAPTYTVEEINLDTGEYKHTSTEELTGNKVEVGSGATLESNLEEDSVSYVRITNEEIIEYVDGNIEISKILETSDESLTPDFEFTLAVTSANEFKYEISGSVSESNSIITTEEGIMLTGYTSYEYDSSTDTTIITVSGGTLSFGYYDESSSEYVGTITATANGSAWESGTFYWVEGESAPTYTVTEVNITDEYTFISIENNDNKVTSSTSITDSLIEDKTVNIIARNAHDEPEEDTIKIIKKVTGDKDYLEELTDDEKTFKFTLEIDGYFTYEIDGEYSDDDNDGAIIVDNVIITGYSSIEYDSETAMTILTVGTSSSSYGTLTFGYYDSTTKTYSNTVEIIGEGSWESGTVVWESSSYTPTYTVTEVEIPDYASMEGWSNETSKVTTSFIKGDVGDQVTLIATNEITKPKEAEIVIDKIASTTNISGNEFEFTLEVTSTAEFKYEISGEYTDNSGTVTIDNVNITGYSSVSYDSEENITTLVVEANGTLTFSNIKITASGVDSNGNSVSGTSWSSAKFTWREGDAAPTYEINEILTSEQEADGIELDSMTDNGRGTLVDDSTHYVSAVNKKDPKKLRGRIQIDKTYIVNDVEIEDVDFDFEITITFANGTSYTYDTTVKSGSSYRSGYFYWNEGEDAPTYSVKEIDLPSGVKCKLTDGSTTVTSTGTENVTESDAVTGSLVDEGIICVSAENTTGDDYSGYLSIVKNTVIEDKVADEDAADTYTGTFEFTINITGTFTYNGKSYDDETLTLTEEIEVSGEGSNSWTSDKFTWTGDAPTYSVDETSSTGTRKLEDDSYCSVTYSLYESSGSYGKLTHGSTSTATFTNNISPIEIINLTIDLGGTVWNDTDDSDGKEADTQENGQIDEGEEGISGVKVTITRVVVDSNGNTITTLEGIYTDSDEAVEENWVYTDSNGNWTFEELSVPALVGTINDDGSYSGEYALTYDGSYIYDLVAAGTYMVSYDVTFSYDGQTYEPTTYLTTSSGDSAAYRNASTSERDAWLSDSMAYELASLRTTFNNKFAEIVGLSDMDVNGNTVGTTNYSDGTSTGIELNYTSEDSISLLNSDNTKKVSTLQTYDTDGTIYDDLLMTASTSTGGLTYPFDSQIHLASWDKDVDLYTGATVTTYNFSATYEYTKNINLGLVEREYTDVSIEKDLTQATVVVNGKVLKYKYNSSIDLSNEENWEEYLYKQIAVADAEIEYTLGLYASDYYYRASVYESDTELWSDLEAFYVGTKNFSSVGDALELEVYLTYTITVHNESETYDLEVNEIVDYYDSSFTIVTNNAETGATSTTYIETLQGEEVNETMELADVSTYSCVDRDGVTQTGTTDWYTYTDSIDGSDGVEYKESRTTALDGIKIASGGTATITTTYKVDKDNIDGISDAITLGDKHNVTEVTNFSSYYKGTDTITGRVDKDSAPDNANVEELNETAYYEDDTDSAPVLTIELVDEDREVNGLVWEDAETDTIEYSQTIGNGLYNSDEGDTVIEGLTTELVETISIPTGEYDSEGNEVYKEYDFIWDTESTYIGSYSLYYLTGFDATTSTDSNGLYEFTGVAAGNYKVRFVYGDTEVLTGNEGYEEVYNGQDYKSTTYQSGYSSITDSDGDGYTDNEWHNLSDENLNSERVSDARDSEARRLVVSAKSEILTYDNTSVLATADDADADHSELFGYGQDEDGNEISGYEAAKEDGDVVTGTGHYMYAETAKLKLEIENVYDTDYETSEYNGYTVYTGTISEGSTSVGNDYTYEISNIDFGLEERSQTELTLDKQIKEITLTTSDGEVILDAVYDIEYELGDDDTIDVSVTLNKWESINYDQIASLNRSGSTQGYRYIMAEGTILQGATINVTYQLTVFNVGEADTCNVILTEIWDEINNEGKSDLYETALTYLTSPYYTESNGRVTYSNYDEKYQYGLYFGSIYYLGTEGTYSEDTMLVESTIHQIIDYIDPDVEFIDTDNLSEDQSWSTTTVDYLVENGLIDPEAIIVVDSDGNPVLMTETDDNGNEVYYKVRTYADGLGDETNSYAFLSDEVQQYITDTKNNVVVSIDDGSSSVNPSLVKATVPYSAEENYDDATASITLEVSRYYSSEEDANEIDNIAEIIKVENTVGRRDIRTIAGNTITYQIDWDTVASNTYTNEEDIYTTTVSIYDIAAEEPDVSATEVITLTPPTGSSSILDLVMQLLVIVGCAGVVIALGIVLIKKKVLIK